MVGAGYHPLPQEGKIIAYIGLGSNLGKRTENILRAVDMLAATPGIETHGLSTLRETKPLGPIQDQPDFMNAVVKIETTLTAINLLDQLLSIEVRLGRVRNERWGPRVIDLDILIYGDLQINHARLKVPHPEIPNRPFVLAGLAELGFDPERKVAQTVS